MQVPPPQRQRQLPRGSGVKADCDRRADAASFASRNSCKPAKWPSNETQGVTYDCGTDGTGCGGGLAVPWGPAIRCFL